MKKKGKEARRAAKKAAQSEICSNPPISQTKIDVQLPKSEETFGIVKEVRNLRRSRRS